MAIHDKGGNTLALAELTSAYALLTSYTSGTNGYKFPNVVEVTKTTNVSETKFRSEDGIVRYSESTQEPAVEWTVMDSDKATRDYLAFSMNSPSLLYHYEGIAGGKHKEYFAIGNPVRMQEMKTPGAANAVKGKFNNIAPNATVTFTSGALAVLASLWGITIRATSVTITNNTEYCLVETSV